MLRSAGLDEKDAGGVDGLPAAASRYPAHRGHTSSDIARGNGVRPLGSEGSPSWAAVEEEAHSRWNKALQVSPKVTSDTSRRLSREDSFVRRELEALEEKLMRQVLRLQEQSERFMDIMVHPLESKVAALEGRQPNVDCSIAELRGNLKGLQDSVEIQVRRADQAETRLRKWRKTIEDDLQSKHMEMKQKLQEAAPSAAHNPDVVTRSELLDVAKMLKQELRKLVDDKVTSGGGDVATRKELAAVAVHLREELTAVERVAAAAHNVPAHKELSSAAEAVRAEMRCLTERAAREESSGSSTAVKALEQASEAAKRDLNDLKERLARSERVLEESNRELRHLREEVRQLPRSQGEVRQPEEPSSSALGRRLQTLEERLQSSLDMRPWEPALAVMSDRLRTLDERQRGTEAVAISGKELRETFASDFASRLDRLEERHKSLQATVEASKQAELGECVADEDIAENQRMLLDLERRVIAVEQKDMRTRVPSEAEGGGLQISASPEVSTSAPGTPALKEVAQLAESLALNLRLARKTAGMSSEQVSARSTASQRASPRTGPQANFMDGQEISSFQPLPPVAAMKVMASPRLQQLSLSPRIQSSTTYSAYAAQRENASPGEPGNFNLAQASTPSALEDTNAVCTELRAEVAAVWDAVAELAELLGDAGVNGERGADPDGVVQADFDMVASTISTAQQAHEAAEDCKRSVGSVSQDLEKVQDFLKQLDSRILGCEHRLEQVGKETLDLTLDHEKFATFDASAGGMFGGAPMSPGTRREVSSPRRREPPAKG